MQPTAQDPLPSADEALARLMAGNERFLEGRSRSASWSLDTLRELAKGQRPIATILGCSDARVPPEVVFDAGLGELFVIRVAGNVLSPEVAGSLEYAGSHLGTPLFVVLGHEGCGAVKAALAAQDGQATHGKRIRVLVDSILPALPNFDAEIPADQRLRSAVECNVREAVRRILESPEGQARQAEGRMKIVGAVYEIESGRVRLLPGE
jgi:carbonic anhydrase